VRFVITEPAGAGPIRDRLDPQARHHRVGAAALSERSGVRHVLLTTHDMESCAPLRSFAFVMDHGRIVTGARPDALIERHRRTHVARSRGVDFGAPGAVGRWSARSAPSREPVAGLVI